MLPSLSRRRTPASPFDALWGLRNDLDRVFNGFPQTVEAPLSGYMPAEVLETDNDVQFRIEVPGLKPEEIEVTVENNVLTVSGERKWEHEEGKPEGEYHLFERSYGRFERSFALPKRVDANRINATCEHGVLSVVLPKMEEAKPRRITVQPGTGAKEIKAR